MNSEKIQSSSSDNKWDILTKETFKANNRRNHLTQDEMRTRIKAQIGAYEGAIRPFADNIDDDGFKTLIKDYEDGDMPLWAIDQGLLHQLESALNLKNKITLWHDNDPKKDTGAYYLRGKDTIIINRDPKAKADGPLDFIEELSGLAHEVFHAYQYEQQLYGDKNNSNRYRSLWGSYNSEDHIAYCNNPIELEAYCFQNLVGKKILKNMHELGRNLDLRIK